MEVQILRAQNSTNSMNFFLKGHTKAPLEQAGLTWKKDWNIWKYPGV